MRVYNDDGENAPSLSEAKSEQPAKQFFPSIGLLSYASGNTLVSLPVAPFGVSGAPSLLGNGSVGGGASLFGAPLPATGSDFSTTLPCEGYLENLAVTFTSVVGGAVSETPIYVHALVYWAEKGGSVFLPVPGSEVRLLPGLNIATLGAIATGIVQNIHFPVAAGTRILLALGAKDSSLFSVGGALNGFASAGILLSLNSVDRKCDLE